MKRTIIQIDKQLDRQISAFFSKNLDKYEYLTGADLDLKPSTAEKAKLEYSPLGMSFNKSFNKNEVKSLTKNRVILIMIFIMLFSNFTKVMMNLKKCHSFQSTIG